MKTQIFQQFFDYHFAENRKLWDTHITTLSDEQFTQAINYSIGSVHNHIIHMISVDAAWFSSLRGLDLPDMLDPKDWAERDHIRTKWDQVEAMMREYLATVDDTTLFTKPMKDEDENLFVWQALLQVVNHGTDHRAQLLRIIHDMGIKTASQDYIFYVYDNA